MLSTRWSSGYNTLLLRRALLVCIMLTLFRTRFYSVSLSLLAACL